jgi:hypothetical protein
MEAQAFFEFFSKFLWPLGLIYLTYLHRELRAVDKKIETVQNQQLVNVAQFNKEFATRELVADLENKLTVVLNRIDDKVTRILEERK